MRIEYCNIQNFKNPNETLNGFITELDLLLKKYNIEYIKSYLDDASISYAKNHELSVTGLNIVGNEIE